MTRPIEPAPTGIRVKSLIRPALLILYSALIIFGQFNSLGNYGVLQYSLIALVAVMLIFEVMKPIEPEKEERNFFWLGLLLMVAAKISIQATGGMDSFLYPLAYLLFAIMVSVLGPGYSLALWLYFMGMEAGWVFTTGWDEAARESMFVHGAYLTGFGVVVGGFVHMERKGRLRAVRVLSQLQEDVEEFQRDDTVYRLSGLSEGGRKKEALRSVFALDEAFSSALETCRDMLYAETCALYWRLQTDQPLHLREIASMQEAINTENKVVAGQGFLGWVVEQAKPLRASGIKRLRDNIPYYPSTIAAEHLMAAPVIESGKVQGLLVMDRTQDNPFTEQDEKLITALAHQIREIHGHALLLRRTEAEASQFKALAELSNRLSRTLELPEILESVVRTSQAIAGNDATAVVLSEDGMDPTIMRTGGNLDAGNEGKVVRIDDTLAGWVMSESQYLVIPDTSDRSQKTPALGKRLDPPGMRSVLIHPLPFRRQSRGALVFFSCRHDAFSRHVIRATGILSDLAAVSINNAFLYREMEQKAITDGLTGLFNHRWFQERLSEELERAQRLGTSLALVLSDIDRFKHVNDAYGHPMGDEVLKTVSGILNSSIRKVDCAARYGGEEFVLILLGTNEKGAVELAERIRKKVGKLVFHADKKEFRVTLSSGIAVYPNDAARKQSLIKLADQALYHAKQNGRNRTVLASSLES